MNETTLTTIIFLTLSSMVWLFWFYLFRENRVTKPRKKKKIKASQLENYLDDIEERYAKTNGQLNLYRQENRELKGKLFQEKNRLMELSERLKELQGRKFIFNSEKIIDDLQYELRTKEREINKLMAKLALTPIKREK
jgi:cell shape-determining protein MreC